MRKLLALITCSFVCTACTVGTVLDMPPVLSQQDAMRIRDTKLFPGSQCADIGGMFLEPPSVIRVGKAVKSGPDEETGSYYGHIPFYLTEREVVKEGDVGLSKNVFLIRQPDAKNFYISFSTKAFGLVEYHFQADVGHFECRDGYIEFPVNQHYGVIEGKSVNFQIRNVILRDNSGVLVIEETLGPYRGNPSTAVKEFRHTLLQYPQYERTNILKRSESG